MKTSNKIKGGLTVIATYVTREFKTIATSYSILLVMIGGYSFTACFTTTCTRPT